MLYDVFLGSCHDCGEYLYIGLNKEKDDNKADCLQVRLDDEGINFNFDEYDAIPYTVAEKFEGKEVTCLKCNCVNTIEIDECISYSLSLNNKNWKYNKDE